MAGNSLNSQYNFSTIMGQFAPDQKTLMPYIDGMVEMTPLLADFPVREAMFIDQDMVNRWTQYPVPYWHKLGEGLTATMGHQDQMFESMGMLRNQMRINVETLKKVPAGGRESWMAQQERGYFEGMRQEVENTIVYGKKGSAPEEFDGLDVRCAAIADNSVFDNGGSDSGNLTTVWLIQPDVNECCLIFPKDGQGGLRRIPKGVHQMSTDTDATGSVESTKAYAEFALTNFEWDLGLCVHDTRRVKAVRNVHKTIKHANELDVDILIQAKNSFRTTGQIYAYMHQDVASSLQIQIKDKGNVWMNPTTPFGEPTVYVLNMPIRISDAILLTETTVS